MELTQNIHIEKILEYDDLFFESDFDRFALPTLPFEE